MGRSAGARLTVILCGGNSAPEFLMADLTLSFDSSIDFEGSPTIVKEGSDWKEISTSTVTGKQFNPMVAPDITFASIMESVYPSHSSLQPERAAKRIRGVDEEMNLRIIKKENIRFFNVLIVYRFTSPTLDSEQDVHLPILVYVNLIRKL